MIDQGVTIALAASDANRSTNGEDSHNSGIDVRRTERVARECTYQDFMKCQPLYFKGTKGVVELTQWFERMKTVFRISNCSMENQTKFSTCTLLASALTWWNFHVMTVGHDVAYAMTWTDLRKKMTDKYCHRNEMKKLETELWNLKVKGTDVIGYNQRFQEWTCCVLDVSEEFALKIERICGLKPYAAGTGERKEYAGTLPLCNRCKLHHNGQCTVKCGNCKKVGHMTRDCRNPAAARNQGTLTCYECGNPGHYRSDCPELKNQNHGNQAEGTGARGMVYAFGGGETEQDINNIEDEIEA
ncbi:reverse transcriptase domain-containing protein [Tanacetum coccineum]|uniref:Reverse transcriptase domain-containing protein n=1 Tax=Tanacetum coccineum TaxID=301880 RepID=A0ABQ5HW30_9ASTR